MRKTILFIAFNFWMVALFAGDTTIIVSKTPKVTVDTAVSVISGIFTLGEVNKFPREGIIIVKDVETDQVVGKYRPNKVTGKFLFILVAGKTYVIRFENDGELYKTINLIVPSSTIFNKTQQNINLGLI